jgi:hypothetical protein
MTPRLSVRKHRRITSLAAVLVVAVVGCQPGTILVSPRVSVLAHGILPDSWDNRVPPDHLSVLAVIGPTCR